MFRQIAVLILLSLINPSFASNWRTLAPGIDYTDIGYNLFIPWSHIHVFKIDPKYNQFELLMAQSLQQTQASADEFANFSQALITINGGFFDNKHNPLGLRISNKKQYNPLKQISWWGVFYIENNKPHINGLKQYTRLKSKNNIEFAVQSGPRLIINGHISGLKPGLAERTALGITNNDNIIILVTENYPLSTTTLAYLMKLSPLNCKNALNLDGGNSSQLNANITTFKLKVHGLSRVSDAIIVRSKAN